MELNTRLRGGKNELKDLTLYMRTVWETMQFLDVVVIVISFEDFVDILGAVVRLALLWEVAKEWTILFAGTRENTDYVLCTFRFECCSSNY